MATENNIPSPPRENQRLYTDITLNMHHIATQHMRTHELWVIARVHVVISLCVPWKRKHWNRLMPRRPGSGVLKQADAQGKLHLNPFAGCPKRPTHSCHSIFFLSIRCPPPSPYWDLMAARGRHNLPPHHATTSKCCLVISGVQTGGRTRLWPGYQRISIWVWTSK